MSNQRFERLPQFGQNWSRSKYDKDLTSRDIDQSTAPLKFRLDPSFAEVREPCFQKEVGWIGKQGVSYDSTKPLVDTESDLFNINRVLSRDPKFKYVPMCGGRCAGQPDCSECQPKLSHLSECLVRNESTRLTNPKSTLRETGVNRFQPICLDPQDPSRWEHPGEVGINYRMVVKDNHVPCLPHPMDQTSALPAGGDLPCDLTGPTCIAPIQALNTYRQQSEKMPINWYT